MGLTILAMKNNVWITLFSFVVCLQKISAVKNDVIDLSHHNGYVDLKKAKEDGIQTVIHKCTQGTNFRDSMYWQNKLAAEKIGLKWAAYHFADKSDGKTQANHFLENAGSVSFYVVDLEQNLIFNNTVGKEQAEDLVEAIKKSTGKYPVVYGNQSFLDSLNSSVLAQCPLWIASYRDKEPKMPKLWSSWYMWQYTDGTVGPEPHTVKGVGKVDRSYINN